jgi:tRNA nucleotidyltransferase (CCA-adding enzyme)
MAGDPMPAVSLPAVSLPAVSLPAGVSGVLGRLLAHGHDAALVGGCVRDLLAGRDPGDWDVATAAPPEVVERLFPGATWENRFGTVTVRTDPGQVPVEVTTYRVEGGYRDRRRPEELRWGSSLAEDLARRDFTMNAVAWVPRDLETGAGELVDPYGGRADIAAGVLRAVGEPDARLAEDALRLVRAVRFTVRFDLRIDAATESAMQRHAGLAASLSGERVRDELLRILATAPPALPSSAFSLMERLGLLEVLLPELQALRGVPQRKPLPGDALDHSLRTADALPAEAPLLRLVGLLHDVGKAGTLAHGHFIGHELAGAVLVEKIGLRLRLSKAQVLWARHLVAHHMFGYRRDWTDAAVRRFIRRVGPSALDELFALRRADNAASGAVEPETGGLDELRRRIQAELGRTPLSERGLAVDGDDLIAELGIAPGPLIGELLARLLEAVIEDPSRNERVRLIALARRWAARDHAGGAAAHREASDRTWASRRSHRGRG